MNLCSNYLQPGNNEAPLVSEPCPNGVYFNFAGHTLEPYRKMGSPIGHVWWLTNDQAISFASRTGKI